MNRRNAILLAARMRKCAGVESAKVCRILPEHIDPPLDEDNGWDVEIYSPGATMERTRIIPNHS